jgi:hypothetical protein
MSRFTLSESNDLGFDVFDVPLFPLSMIAAANQLPN